MGPICPNGSALPGPTPHVGPTHPDPSEGKEGTSPVCDLSPLGVVWQVCVVPGPCSVGRAWAVQGVEEGAMLAGRGPALGFLLTRCPVG